MVFLMIARTVAGYEPALHTPIYGVSDDNSDQINKRTLGQALIGASTGSIVKNCSEVV